MHTLARKTKIVATLGPACADTKTLEEMIRAGMNVARLNFSHGSHEDHHALARTLRSAAKKTGTPVALLQDLSGPKIRIGDFEGGHITLEKGAHFTLTTKKVLGTEKMVHVAYAPLPKEVRAGEDILLDDGKVRLRIVRVSKTDILTEVIFGGMIRSRRGLNVPGAALSIPTITEKDRRDIEVGLALGVNFMTLSFVRSAKDIAELRALLGKRGRDIGIIAKIETAAAVADLDAIIDAADGIMIARGDLAVEIERADVPLVQKDIIARCNCAGKPVITATQMLDSMREKAVPTRAEVNDVANAIFDGTDAVMLSDETAVGAHPALAIETMADVARHTETSSLYRARMREHVYSLTCLLDATASSIVGTARATNACAIVAFSESGNTGRLVARHKPEQPIIVLTPEARTFYQSLLSWGTQAFLVPSVSSLDEALVLAQKTLRKEKYGKKGETFVLGAGHPFGKPGGTNMMVAWRV